MEEKHPFSLVLKNKGFLKIWGSQILSQVTLSLINFVIILRIFEVTNSTVAVSLVWLFYALPVIFLSPFSGTFIDLNEKKKILVLTNLIEAIIVLGYFLVGGKIWVFYSIILIYAVADQFYTPAEAATLPAVIPKKLLAASNTLFMFSIYGTRLIGFSLAGPLMRLAGRNSPFILGSIFLALATLLVSRLPEIGVKKNIKINSLQSFIDQIKEGYGFVRRESGVLFPLIILGIVSISLNVIAFLSPSYAKSVLRINLLDTGLVLILPAGFGAILGARSVVKLIKKVRKKRIISAGLLMTCIALICLGLFNPLLVHGKVFVAAVSVFILGMSYSSLIIPSQTLIQEQTPEKLRGRVFGVLVVLITAASFLPLLFIATIADIIGVKFILIFLGIGAGFLAYYLKKREPYENILAADNRP